MKKGQKMTEEHRRKISEALKGNTHGFKKGNTLQKGTKRTKESIEKQKNTVFEKQPQKGDKNHKWKGKDASYYAIHHWVRKWKPKTKKCEKCGKEKTLEAANISGKYLRDIEDYLWVCRKCHFYIDRDNHPKDKSGKLIKKTAKAFREVIK